MQLIPIDELRIPNDDTLIPRLRDQPYLVSRYAAAMRHYGGWGDFPPVVTDTEALVLSGVHRVEAARETGLVTQVPRKIAAVKTAEQALLIAATGNARHGQPWETRDITRLAILAERFFVAPEKLAKALRISVERVERVPVTSVARRSATGEEGGGYVEKIYAKRAVRAAVSKRILTEREEKMQADLSTATRADRLLRDLIILSKLHSLPPLNPDSYRDLLSVREIFDRWVERDLHLLAAVVV